MMATCCMVSPLAVATRITKVTPYEPANREGAESTATTLTTPARHKHTSTLYQYCIDIGGSVRRDLTECDGVPYERDIHPYSPRSAKQGRTNGTINTYLA